MATRLSTAALTMSLALGLAGCEKLCDAGIQDKCPPCVAAPVSPAWEGPSLQPLMPGDDAIVCEATGEQTGDAMLSYWLPERVHDTNVATVGAAQNAGWIRTGDNWYEGSDRSQLPKWSEFGTKTGHKLRIDIKAESGGTRVILRFESVPLSPALQGDVSIFAYRAASYALQDGLMHGLKGVVGGATIASANGFYFRAAPDRYGQYQPDGTAVLHPAFPKAAGGAVTAHGPGPRGMPWMSHRPEDRREPLVLGELIDGQWDLEVVPNISPPLPRGSVDAVVSDNGTVWLLSGSVLYAKDASGWRSEKLRAPPGPLRPLAAEADSVLVSTEREVIRASLHKKRITTTSVLAMDFYPELFDAGQAGIVARTRTELVLIDAEAATTIDLPGDALAPDIATNANGVIAVATKSPSRVIVRGVDGTITPYPELASRVASMSIDPMGRVWTLLVDGDPVVADRGTLMPLLGIAEDGMRPSSVTFMGNGAPPLLADTAARG